MDLSVRHGDVEKWVVGGFLLPLVAAAAQAASLLLFDKLAFLPLQLDT